MCRRKLHFLNCPLPEWCVYHLCSMRQLSKQVHPLDTTLIQQQLWIRLVKVLPHPPSLQEERHQLQLHPPVAGDNSTLRLRDSKSRPGSVTPTMRVSLSVRLMHIMYSSKQASFQPEGFAGLKPTSVCAETVKCTNSPTRHIIVCHKAANPLSLSHCIKITIH